MDLLLYGDLVLESPDITVPHPRMAWRRFVLEPAAEIAGEMRHPLLGWTVRSMLEHLNTAPKYLAITGASLADRRRLATELLDAVHGRFIAENDEIAQECMQSAGDDLDAYENQLRLVEHRGELLERRSWVENGQWSISDFWFDESLAVGRMLLAGERLASFEQAWQAGRSQIVLPKLIVLLEERASNTPGAAASRTTDDIRDELRHQLSLPNQGPVLRVATDDWAWAREEVLAALQAME
jgi:hypothetical protein